jgi:hypothetical protein
MQFIKKEVKFTIELTYLEVDLIFNALSDAIQRGVRTLDQIKREPRLQNEYSRLYTEMHELV